MKKRILFVDDETKVLQGLKRMLRPMRREWDMQFADSGKKALEMMAEEPFNVVVSDMRMPEMDGAQLLTEVMTRYPDCVRIVLSGQAEKEAMMRSIGPSHQYLSKPCDPDVLKDTVSRACALRDVLSSDRLSFVAKIENLPVLPEIYTDLMKELKSEDPSIRYISRLIEKDMGLTAKILQLVNSAYFGVRRRVTNPAQAVTLLGLENVRSLLLFANVFSQMEMKGNIPGFSMDQAWKHSASVGRAARDILKEDGQGKEAMDDALSAGLLHDCGQLIYAANMAEEYKTAFTLASEENLPLWQAETQVMGASHAEVGAYLLGLWGLPDTIVEALAFHHTPRKSFTTEVNVLTAVHVADVFVAEQSSSIGRTAEENLDQEYLENLGVSEKVETWADLSRKTA